MRKLPPTMLYLLSPAKSLDWDTTIPPTVRKKATEPVLVDRAAPLVERLARLSPAQLAQQMGLSDALAALNVGRFGAWSRTHDDGNSRPAAFAFDGDVYGGLQARTLKPAELDWAQQHLVILSGLYGVLRPLDRLQPYRLEMGTRLATDRGRDLYAYWGDAIAEHLNQRQADERSPVIANLASQEYFRAADRALLRARVVECVFEEWKAGQYKVISFFAKRARGLMARWAIQHRVGSPRKLEGFAEEGYAYAASASTPARLVFRRRAA